MTEIIKINESYQGFEFYRVKSDIKSIDGAYIFKADNGKLDVEYCIKRLDTGIVSICELIMTGVTLFPKSFYLNKEDTLGVILRRIEREYKLNLLLE